MNKSLLLITVIIIASSCKTREKSSKNRGKALVSDDLRLSFKPRQPRVGEEFTVQIEILRDGQVVTDGAGSKATVQLSHRCGSNNKGYSRAQLAEADDGVAEIDLTIGTRRGQAMTCSFRAVAGDVTREKFSFTLRAGDNYRQHDHRHDDNHDRHAERRNDSPPRRHRCGQSLANRHRHDQRVTISKPVTANARTRIAVAKEFTIDNNSSREIDIELIDCRRARLFRYQPQRVLDEAKCHILPSGQTKMFIIGTVDRECDFAIDGRKINFDTFSSGTFRGPACPESPLEQHDVAFRLDDRQWHAIRQDDISRMGNDWGNDETLVRVDGWWCRLDD